MAFAETFKALSDPVRREILQLLKNGKMSAGEIGGHFDMTGATISYHLKILKKADLPLRQHTTKKATTTTTTPKITFVTISIFIYLIYELIY